MRLNTTSIDPATLYRPASVARRLGNNGSMVTYWMSNDQLDYVECADGTRLIPEDSIRALEALRASNGLPEIGLQEVEIDETTVLAEA